jgi:hypothetical protein
MQAQALICLVFFFLVFIILWLCAKQTDKFQVKKECVMGKPCKKDEDCSSGDFCYMGQCWGYWKGYPMPWSTCRNPYCGSTDPYASCSATQGKCTPYCKCQLNRRLGGSINVDCFPKCGSPCLTNDNCPPGCPQCSFGVCSAPHSPL